MEMVGRGDDGVGKYGMGMQGMGKFICTPVCTPEFRVPELSIPSWVSRVD